jgi:transcriptional regulator with XRE-family HTH domain
VAAGFTQAEISIALGYTSAQFISNFERGIAAPPLNKLKVITKLYRIDVSEIVDLMLAAEKAILSSALKDLR